MRLAHFVSLLLLVPLAQAALPGDVNSDGKVNLQDLLAVLQHVGRAKPYQPSVDINNDSAVNVFDLVHVARNLAAVAGAPEAPQGLSATVDSSQIITIRFAAHPEGNGILQYRAYYTTDGSVPGPGDSDFVIAKGRADIGSNPAVRGILQTSPSHSYRIAVSVVRASDGMESASVEIPGGPFITPASEGLIFSDSFSTGDLSYTTAAGGRWHSGTGHVDAAHGSDGGNSVYVIYPHVDCPSGSTCDQARQQYFGWGLPLHEISAEWYSYYPTGNEGWDSEEFSAPQARGVKAFRIFGAPDGQIVNGYNHAAKIGGNWNPGAGTLMSYVGARTQQQLINGDNTILFNLGPVTGALGPDASHPVPRGQWVRMRVYAKLSPNIGWPNHTDPNILPGTMRVWAGDTLIVNTSSIPITAADPANLFLTHGYLFGNWEIRNGDTLLGPIRAYADEVKIYAGDQGWQFQSGADTSPPLLSAGQPSATLASGTTNTTFQITTNEAATCKYSTTEGQAYASMLNTFTTTGSTSHSTTLSDLLDGQNYSYYVRCQDTAGNQNINDHSVSFSVAAPSIPIGGLNEPEGMTEFFSMNGSIRDFGSNWVKTGKWTDDAYTQVVADPTNPTGSGFALEKRWYIGGGGNDGGGLTTLNQFSSVGGFPSREVYYRYRVKYSQNWDALHNHKWGYWGSDGRGGASPTQYYIAGSPGSNLVFADQSSTGVSNMFSGSGFRPQLDAWHTVEVHQVAQSAVGVPDGSIRVWADGNLVINMQNADFIASGESITSPLFNGVQLFFIRGGSGITLTQDDWMRLGEYYISGKP